MHIRQNSDSGLRSVFKRGSGVLCEQAHNRWFIYLLFSTTFTPSSLLYDHEGMPLLRKFSKPYELEAS
jgi:hypothetical protein